jgi:hypothetical protein
MIAGGYVPDYVSWKKYQLKSKQIIAGAFLLVVFLALTMYAMTQFLAIIR